MADHSRMQLRLPIAVHVQKGGALRRAQPFVGIAGVIGGAELRQRSGTIPGACAPSTNVSTPRALRSATRRAMGRTSAVGLVTWSKQREARAGLIRSAGWAR